jgi:hypothetical protein
VNRVKAGGGGWNRSLEIAGGGSGVGRYVSNGESGGWSGYSADKERDPPSALNNTSSLPNNLPQALFSPNFTVPLDPAIFHIHNYNNTLFTHIAISRIR